MKFYYIKFLFLILFAINSISHAQEIDCDFMSPICSNESIDAGSPTTNPGEEIETSCQDLQSNYTHWYYIRIQAGSTFTFTITPDTDLDYDFAVWLNPEDCNNLGVADRGSFAAGGEPTGLSCSANDTCEDAFGDDWVKYLDVQPGDLIVIAVDRWGSGSVDYNLSFGDCGGSGDETVLDCTILGESYGICDLDYDGQEYFDLDIIADDLTEGQSNWTVDFYEVEADAQAGNANTESSPYLADAADNPTELFARIEQGGVFLRVVQIFLNVNPKPQLTVFETDLELCDVGGDGEEVFDLTQTETDFITGPNAFIFSYYEQINDAHAGNSNTINPATAFASGNDEVYVRIETGPLDGNEEGCYSIGTINLILTEEVAPEFDIQSSYCINTTAPALPTVSDDGITGTWSPAVIDTSAVGQATYTFTPDLGQCAIEYEILIEITEGAVPEFTLESTYCEGSTAPDLPLVSDNGIAGTWYPATIDTTYPGTATYTFTPDNASCVGDLEIQIEILAAANLNSIPPISVCDEDFDGIYEYDLTELNDLVLNPNTGYTFIYYATSADAGYDTPIPTDQWSNYGLNGMPNSIWILAESVESCRSEAIEIQFIEGQGINLLSDPYQIPFCEGEPVDLTQYYSLYTSETGVTITYHITLANAQNDTGSITNDTNYIPSSIGSIIYARLEMQGRCPEIAEVEFIAGQEVQHNPGPYGPIEYCEGFPIDLTVFEADMPNESGVTFTYYETSADAQNETNSITNNTAYEPNGDGTIYVRLEKPDRCFVILEINYEQMVTPSVEIESSNVICEGDTIEAEVSSDDPYATFEWTWGNNQSQAGSTISISEPGTYTVTATGSNGCENTDTITIQAAVQPVITSIESGDDYLIVYAESGGGGTLEYSLNGVIWQDNPRFDNLIKGEIYTVYVRENGCMVSSHQAVVLDITNFISPNGDGYNDTWEVRGIQVTPDATIRIFDRYGKIFIDTNFDGNFVWDGKYLGRPLPSGDYWYIMEVPSDGVVAAHKFMGHISIRNQ